MNFPWVSEAWTEPIGQNLYASALLLVGQAFLLILKLAYKKRNTPLLISLLHWVALVITPAAIFLYSLLNAKTDRIYFLVFSVSLVPLFWSLLGKSRLILARVADLEPRINRLTRLGIYDAVLEPHVDDYKEFLDRTVSDFALLGIGAEKLTRDFETFRLMVTRCGTPSKPVRLLLVFPDAEWLREGAQRRGLGQSSFREIQIASLKKIACVRHEFRGHVEVRFYRAKPIFRMLFSNHRECWFGHYTDSVSQTGTNEYMDRSNSNIVVAAPEGKPPDLEFFGALTHYFDDAWERAKGDTWDFKTWIT